MRKAVLLIFFSVLIFHAFPQAVYELSSGSPVYDLLDELASLKVISLNSVIRPYSRIFIAGKLKEAEQSEEYRDGKIPGRIREEIVFYLRDYSFELQMRAGSVYDSSAHNRTSIDPPGYSFTSEFFRMAVRPDLGTQFMVNGKGSVWEFSGGGEAFGYVADRIGFYANAEQTWESEALSEPGYFTMEEGKVWKDAGKAAVKSTEWRGGISYGWKWGDIGVYKDRPVWGNAEHGSNIFSGHAPSFPYIGLRLAPAKWISFQYIHGWLRSDVVDSSRSTFAPESGGGDDLVYRKKYIAANMLTVIPWRGLDISLGNSIIYSDVNPNPYYLIPVLFYNSVDAEKNNYTNNNGSNSQIFFDVYSRQVKHLSLWACLFIDELKVSRILDPHHYNFTSWKLGLKLTDLPVKNLAFEAEWTKTNPMTYKHYIESTNFTSDNYNMGQFLRDNSQEIYAELSYKPLKGLSFLLSFTYAEHGGEYAYTLASNVDITALPVLKNLTWQKKEILLAGRYEIFNRVAGFIELCNTQETGDAGYGPSFMYGKTKTLICGISAGL